jgi:hypothetical protein
MCLTIADEKTLRIFEKKRFSGKFYDQEKQKKGITEY